MKTGTFLTGLAIGAAAAFAINKKFLDKVCPCSGGESDDSEVKEAKETAEKLRNSTDSLLAQLSKSNEEKQESLARCRELEDKVADKDTEIENLKNVIAANDAQTKKLEDELEQIKATK